MNVVVLNIIILVGISLGGYCQVGDDYGYECRIKPRPITITPESQVIGRPGKRGAKGSPGDRGEKGDVGIISDERIDIAVRNLMITSRPTECPNYGVDGITMIYPEPFNIDGIKVYCDVSTDEGRWIVLQRRIDGTVDFYRDWRDYVHGFGNKNGEFWIGLETIHRLTTTDNYELRVQIGDFDGSFAWAKYSTFNVGNAATKYTLTISGYSGTAGNPMASHHNGMKFTTKDSDNDTWRDNCAVSFVGAWWYNKCHRSNLNGNYTNGGVVGPKGITWYDWKNSHYSLKSTEMKIRKIVH